MAVDSITPIEENIFVSFFCDRVPDFLLFVSAFSDEKIACEPRSACRRKRFVSPDNPFQSMSSIGTISRIGLSIGLVQTPARRSLVVRRHSRGRLQQTGHGKFR
jgi:hypothetical protein